MSGILSGLTGTTAAPAVNVNVVGSVFGPAPAAAGTATPSATATTGVQLGSTVAVTSGPFQKVQATVAAVSYASDGVTPIAASFAVPGGGVVQVIGASISSPASST